MTEKNSVRISISGPKAFTVGLIVFVIVLSLAYEHSCLHCHPKTGREIARDHEQATEAEAKARMDPNPPPLLPMPSLPGGFGGRPFPPIWVIPLL